MATHSSILACKIPWTKEPGGLQSMGSQRVGYDWAQAHHNKLRLCDEEKESLWQFFLRILFIYLFWCRPFILKVFIDFVTILLLFYVLFCFAGLFFFFFFFCPRGMWNLGSPTRGRINIPYTGRQNLNHWTSGKYHYGSFNLWICHICIDYTSRLSFHPEPGRDLDHPTQSFNQAEH